MFVFFRADAAALITQSLVLENILLKVQKVRDPGYLQQNTIMCVCGSADWGKLGFD